VLVDLEAPPWAVRFLSDLTDWQKGPLPVRGMRPFEIPDDAYFEYAFEDAQGVRRPDPANPNPRLNPWWTYASNLTGPRYRPDPVAESATGRPRGRLLRLEVESVLLQQRRRVLIYTPAGQADASLPLVLFQDGKAYLGWGRVPRILDLMVERGRVPPAHLVFLPPQDRNREYAFNTIYRQFIVEELLQEVESNIRCDGRRVAWGASLGGLLSAYLAWDHPRIFRKVVAQSGAFLFSEDMDPGNPFVGRESFCREVRGAPPRDIAWHPPGRGPVPEGLPREPRSAQRRAQLGQLAQRHSRRT